MMQTLGVMRDLVSAAKTDMRVRQAAIGLTFNLPAKDQAAEVSALFAYVRDCIRYTRDIHDVETISEPAFVLSQMVGDCDDKTVLLCALAESIGYPTRFVVAGYHDPRIFEHVYCQIFFNDAWVDADATEPHPLGWAPPFPACIAHEGV